MSVALYMARQLWRGAWADRTLGRMMVVCMVSITVGAMAFTLIDAVMRGLEYQTQAVLRGTQPDALVRIDAIDDALVVQQQLHTQFPDLATTIQYNGYVVLRAESSDTHSVGTHPVGAQPVLIAGIVPNTAGTVVRFLDKPWVQQLGSYRVALGASLARSLGVQVGDRVEFLYFDEHVRGRKVRLAQQWFTVIGVFATGVDDVDQQLVVCDANTLLELIPDAVSVQVGVHLGVTDIMQVRAALPGYEVYGWYELYPTLLAALTLERYGMNFVMLLVALIATMNLFALLYVYSTTKLSTLLVLQAMGMPRRTVMRIMYYMGIGMVLVGSVMGISIAWLCSWLLNTYELIPLPDVYYVRYLPAHMAIMTVWGLLIGGILVGAWVVYYAAMPLRKASTARLMQELA